VLKLFSISRSLVCHCELGVAWLVGWVVWLGTMEKRNEDDDSRVVAELNKL
jgi:hypothetical protein